MTADVVVAGGGIGGLAAALAVARRGHRVVVCEREAEFTELGAGVQLAPNGLRALARLGLAEAVARLAVPVPELRFMDGVTGEHVVSMPLDERYRARFGAPYVVAHRGELHRALLAACRAERRVELRASHPVVGYEHTGDRVRVLLQGDRSLTADALVGADGLRSAVRERMLGDGRPRNAGITVYRTAVPMERVPAALRQRAVTWWAGPGRHFVHYPIAGGRYLNLAPSAENAPPEPFSGRPVASATVLAEFAALCEPARRLLELGTGWQAWVLVDREPVRRWTDGRVALLGDAAHPMLHYAAQGACLALEDAVALGTALDRPAGAFAAGLAGYAAARRDRTARVHRLARDSIALWHAAGPAATARNAALARMSASDLYDYVSWLHGPREAAPEAPEAPEAGTDEGTYTLGGFLPSAPDAAGRAPDGPSGTYTLAGYLEPL
ncbi:FAD-dependent monooxygenase [Streptomyces sp. URMC 126]|uniref:FAD-dependent monooxygenase n=1 Tax=Streptomyces sp. URMC 126 TaxID=3423401 RepID=UPI003F19C7F4